MLIDIRELIGFAAVDWENTQKLQAIFDGAHLVSQVIN